MGDHVPYWRIPGGVLPVPGFDIHGVSVPCELPGGDGIGCFPMGGGLLGLVVGDVAGHGSEAARITGAVYSRLGDLLHGGIGPPEAMAALNDFLHESGEEGRFMTLLLVRLDVAGRSFTCVRAGHNPPLLYRRGPDAFEDVEVPGIALGMVRNLRYAESPPVGIGAGDVLLLFTDCLVETTGFDGGQFGERRAAEVIRRHRDRASRDICEALLAAAGAFHGGGPPEDDLTALVVRGL